MRVSFAGLCLLLLVCFSAAQTTQPIRKIHPATQPGEVLDVSIKDLGNFDFDPDSKNAKIPDDVKAISGATVKLQGLMLPIDQSDELEKFALVTQMPPNGPYTGPFEPSIQHTIVITCAKSMHVKFLDGKIVVQGKLSVDVVKEDGFVVQIFTVAADSVKSAK
jgi:hypothetical protein